MPLTGRYGAADPIFSFSNPGPVENTGLLPAAKSLEVNRSAPIAARLMHPTPSAQRLVQRGVEGQQPARLPIIFTGLPHRQPRRLQLRVQLALLDLG